MKPEDFFKMREEQKKKEAEMSPEELAALNAARTRHACRVRDEIITSHELDQQKKAASDELQSFWKYEYPKLSLDERKKYWLRELSPKVYWDGATGNIESSVFSEDNYKNWKIIDLEMDEILNHVLDALDSKFSANGNMKQEIEKILKRER